MSYITYNLSYACESWTIKKAKHWRIDTFELWFWRRLFFFPFIFISWRLSILQYCSGFCYTLIWISHGFTCVPHPDTPSRLPPYPIPLGPLVYKEIQPVHPKGDQPWVFIGRTDAEAKTPILWPPHVKSWLIGKDPDAGRDWGQEEKGTAEDEMARWHHWLNGHEFV